MNILLLRGFNNYFNRVVKKYSTLTDYRNNSTSYLDLASINFNPNDGVVAELIIGSTDQKENNAPLAWDEVGTPDYCVCYENNTIKFRWFVLESERTRKGQYRIALKRDVIAEHFDQVLTAPCFVEKGSVSSLSNPLLYNNESMTYNQIKKQEIALKDPTESGWIVGYLAKNRANTPHNVSTTIAITDGVPGDYIDYDDLPFSLNTDGNTLVYNYIQDTLTTAVAATHIQSGGWGNYYIQQGWKLNNFNTTAIKVSDASDAAPSFTTVAVLPKASGTVPTTSTEVYNYLANNGYDVFGIDSAINFYDQSGNALFAATPVKDGTDINLLDKYCYYGAWGSEGPDYPSAIQRDASLYNAVTPTMDSTLKTTLNSLMGSYAVVTANDLRTTYNGKYVKINNEYYRMSISEAGADRYDVFTSVTAPSTRPTIEGLNGNTAAIHANSTIGNKLEGVITSQGGNYAGAVNTASRSGSFVIAKSKGYNIVLSRISTETLDTTLNTGRRVTYDCVADIFAIPYGEMKYKLTTAGDTYTTSRDEGLAIARAIAQELGESVCYDLQLVPYVPSSTVRDLMAESDTLCLADLESVNYDTVTRTFTGVTSNATFILYVSSCKGTFDIPVALNPKDFGYGPIMNAKISNETEICRLVSPNFNSMFEFSLAKNRGITKINVDYTYKPYMPYIHMNPDFKGLYGQDWDDARGLILGGDFSLAFLNAA